MKELIKVSDVPNDIMSKIREQFEADPHIRQMRIQQGLAQRSGNWQEALRQGKDIEYLFSKVLQSYLEETERQCDNIDLAASDLPKADRDELVEIIVTLFLAADIIDTATMDFNDVLHRTNKEYDMAQFNDIRELSKAAKAKLEYFSTHSPYMKDLSFGERSDNMYGLLRNKAKSVIRKVHEKKAKDNG